MPAAAEPLIFLPGLLCDPRLFAAQLAALPAAAGGEAPAVADLTRDDSVAAMARRVLAAAPARFALCALSMGGAVAFEILRQAPERVARLALVNTQARDDTPEVAARRHALMDLARAGSFREVTERLLPLLLHPSRLGDAGLTGTVHAMAEAVGPDAFLRQERALLDRPDSRPGLAAIACPTLVLGGREDALMPPDRQLEMALAIPRATLLLLPECGHLAPLEAPAAVTRALGSWLRDG